jgi:hypothetical protein
VIAMRPKVGKTYILYYGPGNINNRQIHICAVVDDDFYVCRSRAMHYTVEHVSWFDANEKYLEEK